MSMLQGLPTPNVDTTLSAPAVVPPSTNGYISLPVTTDPAQLTADAFGFIAEQIPGYIPQEGHLEAWLIEACARMFSSTAAVASQVPVAIFMFYGGLVGVNPEVGVAATASTTWTVVNADGYTIPAGTTVAYTTAANALILFQTTADVVIPAGQTQTAIGGVTIQAATTGSAGNGFAPGSLVLVDSLSFVQSVVSTSTSAGGSDAETVGAYLNRLSNQLQLLSPRPILPADFASLAQNVAGVGRAVCIDNWNGYGNLLTAQDASFESATPLPGSFNCSVAQSTAEALDGTHSLAVTSTGSGVAIGFDLGPYLVAANTEYTAVSHARAAATAQTASVNILWYNAAGTLISTSTGTGVADTTTGWTALSVTATSPATAVSAYVQPYWATTSASSEVHYADEVGLFLGTNTTWSAGGAQGGQERMVTVVPVAVDGTAPSSTVLTNLQTYLEGMRETNFVVNVVPPTYQPISVVASVVAQPTASVTTVQAAVVAALDAYLNPGTWAGGSETPQVWLADFTVRYLNVAGVILNTTGVQSISSLTLNGGTSDITLPGTATLPLPTVNVSVSAGVSGT